MIINELRWNELHDVAAVHFKALVVYYPLLSPCCLVHLYNKVKTIIMLLLSHMVLQFLSYLLDKQVARLHNNDIGRNP